MFTTDEAANAPATHPYRRAGRRRKVALLLGALAIVGMGAVTVSCSSTSEEQEKPTESSVTNPSPTEKNLRTNVTRAPGAVAPPGSGHGNAAVPCGFGPAGGAPCGNNG